MLGAIINLLYPAVCRACGKNTGRFNLNICESCARKIKLRLPPFCERCGRQLRGDPELAAVCPDCKNDEPYFDRAWSACFYDDTLKGLIHDFKYRGITSLSKDFTSLMLGFMRRYKIGLDSQAVLSVPMHPGRLFKREINHSDVLAKDLAKAIGIPCYCSALKKIKNTPLQSKLKRQERIKNLLSSFSVKNSSVVLGKNILLVDDLFTTGSTVNECSRILKNSGARHIEVVTLARGDVL